MQLKKTQVSEAQVLPQGLRTSAPNAEFRAFYPLTALVNPATLGNHRLLSFQGKGRALENTHLEGSRAISD